MADTKIYHGTAKDDLQGAILAAHEQYVKAAHQADPVKDMFTTKVVSFGVETGGITQTTTFFANVQETPHEPG
jgi:hypothetical protein